MKPDDEIRILQQELDDLKARFNEQFVLIRDLQQRISRLSGKPAVEQKEFKSPLTLENFIGLRLIHIVGIVVLVIGLSIGVKYAIDRNLISEGLRISLAYGAGILLYVISYRLKKQFAGFSAILFSGAMASLYFTTYSAHVYYNMFPFAIAFILMVLLTFFTTIEALRYNREEIALLGLVGAYGIPFLISKNADRPELLFVYILLINLGVLYLMTRKQWRFVGMAAMGISWIIFLGWAAMRLTFDDRGTGMLFTILFFLLFSCMVVSVKLFHKAQLQLQHNYQQVLNNVALYIAVLFVFGIQSADDQQLPYSTLIISLWVGLQAWLVHYLWKEEEVLAQLLTSMSWILLLMFVAFNWDGFTVTLLWLAIAVVSFAVGVWKASVRIRMAAMILIGVTLAKLLAVDSIVFTTVQKVIAYLVLGVLLLVVSFFYQKFRQHLFDKKPDAESRPS